MEWSIIIFVFSDADYFLANIWTSIFHEPLAEILQIADKTGIMSWETVLDLAAPRASSISDSIQRKWHTCCYKTYAVNLGFARSWLMKQGTKINALLNC